MTVAEFSKAAAAHRPFVEIAHQHRRRAALPRLEAGEDGMGLPPAPKPRQVEMHSDHPKLGPAHLEVRHHRAARLQRREVDELLVDHVDMLLHQKSVAVPAEAFRATVERHRLIVAMLSIMASGSALARLPNRRSAS
jgi:hypothetical protein